MRMICWLCASMATAAATPVSPATAAVDFLEKVRSRSVNLEPAADTALAPQTSDAKRQQIARRLERLGKDLGTAPLEVAASRIDRNLAAVLVRQADALDMARLRVLAIALIRKGDDWLPAPVPGSFENCDIRHTPELGEPSSALENWMLREQALELGRLRDQTLQRVRRQIETSLPAETLRGLDSLGVCERFLDACAKRDLAAALGLLGGLSDHLPEDWEWRLRQTRDAFEQAELPHPWQLLGAPDVLRVMVEHDADEREAVVLIACIDPRGNGQPDSLPRPVIIQLGCTKSPDGMWRVDPPADFFQPSDNDDTLTENPADSGVFEAFPARIREKHPAAPRASAEEIELAMRAAMRDEPFPALVPFILLDSSASTTTASLIRAAQDWRALHEPSNSRELISHGFKAGETAAVALWQVFSPKHPDRLDLRRVHFHKTADGWLWVPVADRDAEEDFRDWLQMEHERLHSQWRGILLAASAQLAGPPPTGAPSADEARAVVEDWLRATSTGDLQAAIRQTTRLSAPESDAILLRNIGHEMAANSRAQPAPGVIAVHRSERWALVAARSVIEGKELLPLYPVLQTPSGPRLLAEIDLFASGGRSRDFLNRAALDHLRRIDEPAALDLQQLLSKAPTADSPTPP